MLSVFVLVFNFIKIIASIRENKIKGFYEFFFIFGFSVANLNKNNFNNLFGKQHFSNSCEISTTKATYRENNEIFFRTIFLYFFFFIFHYISIFLNKVQVCSFIEH